MDTGRAPREAPVVKNPPGSAGDIGHGGRIPGWGRSPGEGHGKATHSSVLAWRIPWTEEPGGLQSTGSLGPTGLKRLSMNARMVNRGAEAGRVGRCADPLNVGWT